MQGGTSLLDVQDAVRAIIRAVRDRGDAPLIVEFTQRFDRLDLSNTGLRIAPEELTEAYEGLPAGVKDALALAYERIESHHRRQLPADERYTDAIGAELGHRWTAIASAGLYVPGGKASYPSSVSDECHPREVAGVRDCHGVPTPDGDVNQPVLAAAHLAGLSVAYRSAVRKRSPRSPTARKHRTGGEDRRSGQCLCRRGQRHIFGTSGIDMIAGPPRSW